jgi:DNA topoisomerase I
MGDAGSVDAITHAKAAGLHYVDHAGPGITRRRHGRHFSYVDPRGQAISDPDEIARLKRLAIPPAYREVWICPDPDGHLQAVGRDARGRLQYRYHPKWRLVRDEDKFAKVLIFGEVLPKLRRRVDADLRSPGLDRERVLASVVSLMEKTLARVGNDEYATANNSFGLTTLRHDHADVQGRHLTFDFRAKHGIERHIDLSDPRLARVIGRLQDLSGQRLFQYLDDDGQAHIIHSQDVNAYLREATGEDITAKDFRTFAATQLAALALASFEAVDTKARAKKNLLRTIETVAAKLGNTPAICRKSYIHPEVMNGYLDGSLREALLKRAESALEDADAFSLGADELAVTAYLARRLRKRKAT